MTQNEKTTLCKIISKTRNLKIAQEMIINEKLKSIKEKLEKERKTAENDAEYYDKRNEMPLYGYELGKQRGLEIAIEIIKVLYE